jgi:hypothetical protein
LLSTDNGTSEISLLFLQTSLEVYDLQIKFLGKDHCDVATTCKLLFNIELSGNDIANGIDTLLNTGNPSNF